MARKNKQTLDQEMQEAHDAVHKEREDAEFDQVMETPKQLTPQEQLEAMRLYVHSMQKVQGHTNEEVRNIIHSIHKRIILVLNYSGLDDKIVKPLKTELDKIVKDEQERYKDEQ